MSNEVEIRVTVKDQTKKGSDAAEQNVKKAADKSSKSMEKWGNRFKIGGLAIGGALAKIGFDAVQAASDTQQSLGGTEAVFGKFAAKVKKTSLGAAEAVGLSANQYRESANIIGSLLKGQGVAMDQLGKKTDNLIKFGADLSATYGGTAAKAVEALTAAYKGEFDPIQQYGITLKQSTITMEAYAVAHVNTAKEFAKLSVKQQQQAMQQATTNLLMKQGKDAQGQFASQSGTLAEQVQILKAKYTDLSAELGAKLIPIMTKVLDKGIKLVGWLEKHPAVAEAAAIAIGALAAGFIALGVAMMANPVSLIVAALVLLGGALVMAYKKSDKFRAVVITVFKAVGGEILLRVGQIVSVFGAMFDVLGHLPGAAGRAFRSAANSARAAKKKIDEMGQALKNLPTHKEIKIRVGTIFYQKGKAPGSYGNGLGVLAPGQAHGGVIGHAAEGGPRSGWILTGENGPEFVKLAPGSTVKPAGATAAMMGDWDDAISNGSKWDDAVTHRGKFDGVLNRLGHRPMAPHRFGPKASPFVRHANKATISDGIRHSRTFADTDRRSGGGGAGGGGHGGAVSDASPTVIKFQSDGSRLGDAVLELVRKSIRTKGGNVQLVLGS